MEHDGHRERLRQRFLSDEMEGFAPHEALELLLTYAIPRRDTNALAHQLIEHFGSLHAVLEAPVEELTEVSGIGENTATLIHMLLPFFRLYERDRLAPKPTLANYKQVQNYCLTLLNGITTERFYVLCFDARLHLISAQLIAEGTLNEVAVYPRRVLSVLLRHNATGAVLCHNHPGGSPCPSEEDIALTDSIDSLLSGVGIRLYDHILVAGNETRSFQALHLLGGQNLPEDDHAASVAADRPRLTRQSGERNAKRE